MSDQRVFPHGRIAMDNGDLIDVTDVTHNVTNNGKLVHTLRRSPAGNTTGVVESTVSFNAVVSSNGPERAYLGFVLNATQKQIRIKIPGETITVDGIVTERSTEVPIDDAVKFAIQFIGKTVI